MFPWSAYSIPAIHSSSMEQISFLLHLVSSLLIFMIFLFISPKQKTNPRLPQTFMPPQNWFDKLILIWIFVIGKLTDKLSLSFDPKKNPNLIDTISRLSHYPTISFSPWPRHVFPMPQVPNQTWSWVQAHPHRCRWATCRSWWSRAPIRRSPPTRTTWITIARRWSRECRRHTR